MARTVQLFRCLWHCYSQCQHLVVRQYKRRAFIFLSSHNVTPSKKRVQDRILLRAELELLAPDQSDIAMRVKGRHLVRLGTQTGRTLPHKVAPCNGRQIHLHTIVDVEKVVSALSCIPARTGVRTSNNHPCVHHASTNHGGLSMGRAHEIISSVRGRVRQSASRHALLAVTPQ
jgi:hypothetical protein